MSLRTIGMEELNNFQLDESGRLYWKGETVILERRFPSKPIRSFS